MTTRDEWLESLSPEDQASALELMADATEACVEDIENALANWKLAIEVLREAANGYRTGDQNDEA